MKATVEPTERSMPRVRITMSWPIASAAMTAVWKPRFVRLLERKKNGERIPITITRTARISTGPSSTSRSPQRSARRRAAPPTAAISSGPRAGSSGTTGTSAGGTTIG